MTLGTEDAGGHGMKPSRIALPACVALTCVAAASGPADPDVQIQHDTTAKQYVITIDKKPFTTYRYGDEFLDKPIFYPVRAPNGARVNREYPMIEGLPGESSDHPHHQSLFFTYDEVNGTNFWNPERTGRRIQQRGNVMVSGSTLKAMLDWKDKDGNVVLEEDKATTFGGTADAFWLDHNGVLK